MKLKEDHGMGYSHNVSLPQDTNTMNKPTIGITEKVLKEYGTPESREKAVSLYKNDDRAYGMIYLWVKNEVISFQEFKRLIDMISPVGY